MGDRSEEDVSVGKKAKDLGEAFAIGETFRGKPNAFIQWKGTNVCMDIYCKCGTHSHVDGHFAYVVQCPECKTQFATSCHVELIELENRNKSAIEGDQ